MKHGWKIFWILSAFLLAQPARAEESLTLRQCFDLSLRQSERVAIQEENIHAAEAKFLEAVGAVLPKINFKGTEFLQDDSAAAGSSGSSLGSSFTRFSKPELKFSATQPIFSGFREFHALAAVRAQKESNREAWEQAKRDLFLDVGQAFYAVLQLEEEVTIVKETTHTLEQRLKDLSQRIALGKSRSSERISTEAELATTQASLAQLEGSSMKAREVLAFFTGTQNETLIDDLSLPANLAEETDYTRHASERPDLKASKAQLHVSKSLLAAERGDILPTIKAEANYYPYRVGFQKDIQWDALFSLDVPLFQGGQTRGKIQEAKIGARQAELALNEKKRATELEIKQVYQDVLTATNQVAALRKAETKSEENYHVLSQDYNLGLTNNLEVLTAMKNWQEMKRNYWAALLQSKVSYLKLKVAAGESIP